MSAGGARVALERLYQRADTDVDFRDFMRDHDVADDAELAELIEADGRQRIARDRPVPLERYLDAIPDLRQRLDSLDAAIDIALRGLSRDGRADAASIETLVRAHPDLEGAIRESAVLSNALVSTAGLQATFDDKPTRRLPSPFGPLRADGGARYLLRELLGTGAFGQVFLAVDRELSEPDHEAYVAIKVLRTQDDPVARQRLTDEATKARRVDHRNVVRVMDRGVTGDDEDYIVYEFVDGGDLALWLDDNPGPMPPRAAARLIADVARGVQAAHAAGLVHCDLKPGNIMRTRDGVPKVADFGIAARLGEVRVTTEDGERPLGNLAFIAPEQFRKDDDALTTAADVYALGGLLYRLLTAKLPNGSTPDEIARNHHPEHGRAEAPSPAAVLPIDRDLDLVCRRAMAVRSEDRHATAAALADDLEAWLRREPIRWTKPSMFRVARLWAARKPAFAVVSTLLVLAVPVLVFIGVRNVQQQQAIEAQEATQAAVKAALQDAALRIRARMLRGDRVETELYSAMWLLETAMGPTVLGTRGDRSEMWDVRVETVRELIETARAAGEADTFETLVRETQLCFWLVSDGDHVESAEIVARIGPRWAALFGADDPIMLGVDALRHGVEVNRVVAGEAEASDQLGPGLRALEQRIAMRAPGSPTHYLLLDLQMLLFGPEGIDDEAARKRAAEARDALLR